MPLEKTIKANILQYLNSLPQCYARGKHSSPFSKGWADVLGSLRGRTLVFEVKQPKSASDPRPKQDATPLQQREQVRWFKAGAIVGVVTSLEDVKAIILSVSGGDAPIGHG